MLDSNVIKFLKNNSLWFDDVSDDYKSALTSIGLNLDTDISCFYLHAEDGATFYSRNQEIYQLCWFVINTDYDLTIKSARNAYNLSDDYIPLNDISNGTYFYNLKDKTVIFMENANPIIKNKWNDFSLFMLWFFNLT